MNIRKSNQDDISKIMEIIDMAKILMRNSGNFKQWPMGVPSYDTVLNDINNGNSFVVEDSGKEIIATFAFIIGDDPTYSYIENGSWLNNRPYGTIHRIASSGKKKGILGFCLDYCSRVVSNIRIDTHEDNKIMQHLLMKNGFKYCGIIYLMDGNPRLAYQKEFCI